jgi:tetratricopeptide (TPR) repeat protein
LARIDFDTGRFAPALERMEAVERMYRERGDKSRQSETLSMLGFTHQDLGHLDEAERLHREALNVALTIGYKGIFSWQYANLARMVLWQGKLEEASQIAKESVAIVKQLGGRDDEITGRLTVGGVQVYAGQYQQARHELAKISSVVESEGNACHKAWIAHLRGLLALIDSSFAEAQSGFETSLNIWHSTYPHHFVSSLTAFGLATFRLGQLAPARQHFAEVLASAQECESTMPALAALPAIALLLATRGDKVRAIEMWSLANSFPFIANSPWFEDVAGREIESQAASLLPDEAAAAVTRGRLLDLWETVEQLLKELN